MLPPPDYMRMAGYYVTKKIIDETNPNAPAKPRHTRNVLVRLWQWLFRIKN